LRHRRIDVSIIDLQERAMCNGVGVHGAAVKAAAGHCCGGAVRPAGLLQYPDPMRRERASVRRSTHLLEGRPKERLMARRATAFGCVAGRVGSRGW
jgi:hypothetical protein